MTKERLLATLTHYVAEEILEGDAEDLEPTTPLLDLGVLNSLEVARMMSFVQRQYGITVPMEAMRIENLATLAAIADMVHGLWSEQQ